jgi:quinol-cytochrome oxidoreductase complex cytochrome b subunit
MVLDQAAPLLFASVQVALALILAMPALVIRSLRRPVRLAAITAAAVFIIVLGVVLASDLTSPTGSAPIGTTLFIGAVGGLIWATFFFILAYIPLGLLALVRARRR